MLLPFLPPSPSPSSKPSFSPAPNTSAPNSNDFSIVWMRVTDKLQVVALSNRLVAGLVVQVTEKLLDQFL